MGEVPVVVRVAVLVRVVTPWEWCATTPTGRISTSVSTMAAGIVTTSAPMSSPMSSRTAPCPAKGFSARAHTAVVPGSVWKPPPGFPR